MQRKENGCFLGQIINGCYWFPMEVAHWRLHQKGLGLQSLLLCYEAHIHYAVSHAVLCFTHRPVPFQIWPMGSKVGQCSDIIKNTSYFMVDLRNKGNTAMLGFFSIAIPRVFTWLQGRGYPIQVLRCMHGLTRHKTHYIPQNSLTWIAVDSNNSLVLGLPFNKNRSY